MELSQPQTAQPPRALAISFIPDLIFSTKVHSTAKALQLPHRVVKGLKSLGDALAADHPRLLIVDMAAGPDAVSAIKLAKAATTPPKVVVFLSHVDVDLAQAARAAGADAVMARSAFTVELPKILDFARHGAGA